MRAILIHGMGRTPLAMLLLAARLRRAGITPILFGYTAMLQSFASCRARLRRVIDQKIPDDAPYIIIGHSLGGVLARSVLPDLRQPPTALFLLAAPSCACRSARSFQRRWWFRLITGTMGKFLADENLMRSLPVPTIPTKIYAGNKGARWRWLPLHDAPNDAVVTVAETSIAGIPMQIVPSIHTFIMNSASVTQDIIRMVKMSMPPPSFAP